MNERESPEAKKANMLFRKTEQAKEGAQAWTEYLSRDAAMAKKTAGLKEQRLARDTAAAAAPPGAAAAPKAKRPRKAASKPAGK
jgi:hypothetical protein